MASNPFTIYQNHPLDSYINVSMHYVNIDNTMSNITISDDANCNTTIFSVQDGTNGKRWFVCELHLDDLQIHGTFTIWEGVSSIVRPTKEQLLQALRSFVESAKADKASLGI